MRTRADILGSWFRLAAILVFLATAALPLHRCEGTVSRRVAAPRKSPQAAAGTRTASSAKVPAEQIVGGLVAGCESGGLLRGLWNVRTWYPFLLAPLWLGGLLLLPRSNERGRRRVGLAFLALSGGLAVFEAFYISADYRGLLRGTALAPFEAGVAWSIVVVVLFWRPRGFRVADVEATIAAQGLLGMLHAFTFPAEDAIRWLHAGHAPDAVARAVFASYLPGFWLAAGALAACSLPAYAPRIFARRSRAAATAAAPAEASALT